MRKAGAPSAKRARTTTAKAAGAKARTKALALVNKPIYRALPLSRNVGQYHTGFPKQFFMRHKYMQSFTITTAAAAQGTFELSCNGIFDPDNAGATTHQPMYRDQMVLIYAKYVVMASKVTYIFNVAPTSAGTQLLVGANIITATGGAAATAIANSEQPSALWRVIPGTAGALPQVFKQTNQITLKWDAKKAFGGDVIDNTSLGADSGANPTDQQFFNFYVQDAAAPPAAIAAVAVTAIVEYSVQWFDLVTETPS